METITITVFFTYLIGAFLSAGLSIFVEACLQEGMLFHPYLKLLYRIEDALPKDWQKDFLKPLGLCIYCFSTWIAIATFTLYFGLSLEIFYFLGLNYIFTKILMKL